MSELFANIPDDDAFFFSNQPQVAGGDGVKERLFGVFCIATPAGFPEVITSNESYHATAVYFPPA